MKKRMFFIIALILSIGRLGVSAALDNPAGIATVPQSSIRSGLIRSPNPIDRSGNLIITGNVGGGKHFRGVVPYSATSNFTGPLGSSSLDSFLRQSASSQDLDIYTGTSRPYFSRSRTVSTTMAGQSRVVSSPNALIEAGAVRRNTSGSLLRDNTFASGRLSDVQDLTVDSGLKVQPVSARERLSLANLDTYSQGYDLADTLRLTRVQGITNTLSKDEARIDFRDKSLLSELPKAVLREPAPKQEAKLIDLKISNQQIAEDLASRIEKIKEMTNVAKSRALKETDSDEALLELESAGVIRKDVPELGDIASPLELESRASETSSLREDDKTVTDSAMGDLSKRNLSDFGRRVDLPMDSLDLDSYRRLRQQNDVLERRVGGSTDIYATESLPLDRTLAVESATRDYEGDTKTLSDYQERFARFSKERIRQHLKNAEGYLKQGEYYRAADKYTLASVYTTDNTLVWAGKGHALFASGEYVSSVLFLSKAFGILSEVGISESITAVVSLSKNFLLIDRDVIDSRMVDIKQWLKESDAGELHFLTGYVYYQLGRFDEAESAIGKALEKLGA